MFFFWGGVFDFLDVDDMGGGELGMMDGSPLSLVFQDHDRRQRTRSVLSIVILVSAYLIITSSSCCSS